MKHEKIILKEGGNIFKTPEGPITQRIATSDVKSTINWLNKTFGFKFVDEDMLGTTGKKNKPDGSFEENSSGDIDLNVDIRELPKEEIIKKLTAWCQKQGIEDLDIMNKGRTKTDGWVANAGLQVHFRTPINGNPKNGFVQTDFMLTDDPDLQRGAKRGGTENFSGADRAVMLSSIARGRGLKFSPTKGLVDPEKGDEVVANKWADIAKILLGPGAKEEDTHTVEQMLAKIKNLPEYEQLVQGIRDNFEKQGRMFPESAKGIMHGIKLAEARVDELVFKKDSKIGKAVKGVGKLAAKTVGKAAMMGRDAAKAGVGGYRAGRAAFSPGGSVGDMAGAYGSVDGAPKTTIGQVSDKVKQKIIDPAKRVAGYTDDPVSGKSGVEPDANDTIVVSVQNRNGSYSAKKIKYADFPKYQKRGYVIGDMTKVKKESIELTEGARIDHLEDLVIFQGTKGAKKAIASLKSMVQGGHENVTVKWDGSPAIIFGRNEDGEFILTDKSGFTAKGYDGKSTSAKDLESMLMARPGASNPDKEKASNYKKFVGNMASIFDLYQKAVPKDFRGFFKGDLLYFTTPPIKDGYYTFTPQIVTYSVKADTDLGKRIGQSTTGIVLHREIDPEGNEGGLKNPDIMVGNSVMVFPSVTVENPPQINKDSLKQLINLTNSQGPAIDKLLDPVVLTDKKMKKFSDILYNYINSKVDTGLQNLGKDFMKWLDTKPQISMKMKQKIIEHVKENMNGFTSLWQIVGKIQTVKDDIIKQLDNADTAVKSTTAGKPGGEGYVYAGPDGDMVKLVNRSEFTAANRAVQR
jgi:hypothetical protein